MFHLFRKNKLRPQTDLQTCNHKWKDFLWYVELSEYDRSTHYYETDMRYCLKVKEPYVCVKCKKRRDETLFSEEYRLKKEREAKIEELKAQYPDRIRPIIEIEDMVKDEQLVDREYLKLISEFKNPNDEFAGTDLFAEIQALKQDISEDGVVLAK